MPYRYKRRRGYYKRKSVPFWKRKYSLSQVANSVWKLKKLVNAEAKFVDTASSGSIVNTGNMSGVYQIAQGDGVSQRQGNSVRARDCMTRIQVTQHASATETNLRAILVIDHQNQGSMPAVTDILETASIVSNLQKSNDAGRFSILFDKLVTLSSAGSTIKNINVYKKLGHHMKFNGTTAAEASQGRGSMYILWISNESTNTPTVTWNTRLNFYDN